MKCSYALATDKHYMEIANKENHFYKNFFWELERLFSEQTAKDLGLEMQYLPKPRWDTVAITLYVKFNGRSLVDSEGFLIKQAMQR